jgi:hypothetical protein
MTPAVYDELVDVLRREPLPLTTAAKFLVEALIEGKITENELKAAQEALQRGDTGPDRDILRRLMRKGFGVPNEPPLFPDLEALQRALSQTDDEPPRAAEGGV